jgi:hypothetical protein
MTMPGIDFTAAYTRRSDGWPAASASAASSVATVIRDILGTDPDEDVEYLTDAQQAALNAALTRPRRGLRLAAESRLADSGVSEVGVRPMSYRPLARPL